MTSLKDLINSESDDDQALPSAFSRHHKSAKRLSHLETVLSPTNHASPADNSPTLTTSFTPFNARKARPAPPPNSSSTSESWQASSSGGKDAERRPSNTSIDSTDPSHASLPSSSTMRFTPVTGRVSKAKKGIPVHNCNECTKTFTRAEHLRRHKLIHRPPGLTCPVEGCEKTFYRKDLLERHQLKCEKGELPGRGGSQASPRRRKNSSPPDQDAPRESGLQMPRGFGGTGAGLEPSLSHQPIPKPSSWKPSTTTSNSSQTQVSSPEVADSGEDCAMTDAENNYTTSNLGPADAPYTPGSSQPRVIVQKIEIPDAPSISFQDSSGLPSPGSDSPFSTPTDPIPDYQFPAAADANWATSMQSLTFQHPATEFQALTMGPTIFSPLHPASSPPTYPVFDGLVTPLTGYDSNVIFGPVRSLSPNMPMPSPSETLLSTPSMFSTDRSLDGLACGRPPIPLFNGPVIPSLTDAIRRAIPRCLDVYWRTFDPQIPIIHRSTFANTSELSEDLDVLQCAMAAIATQYMDGEEDRIMGDQLHAYATHKFKTINNPASGRSFPLDQAQILCDFYARFRGKKKDSYRASYRFGSLYQRTKDSVLRTRKYAERWKGWVKFESTRRLLAACFLFDVHCSHYHNQPYAMITGLDYHSFGSLRIPLSTKTTKSWNAQSQAEWELVDSSQRHQMLNELDWKSLTHSDIASMSAFDASIILAAISLQLPSQLSMALDTEEIHPTGLRMAQLFSESAIANTYLALYYTPLRPLLSVSGDTWVFNEKITDSRCYASHRQEILDWAASRKAAIATVFAARALRAFLHLTSGHERQGARVAWMDISDYWGVYVCALICWAFGTRGQQNATSNAETRLSSELVQWILEAAGMDPNDVHDWNGRFEAHEVVGLVHEVLAADCLGGRNMLFVDAVRVLRKLGKKD